MASPSVTARTLPSGYKLPEGHKAFLAFSLRASLSIWEAEIGPLGFGASKIDTTTQINTKWDTFWMSNLLTPQDQSGNAGYDPDEMDNLIVLCGAQGGSFTVHMPQNTKYSYWGGLLAVNFQPLRPKQFPLINYTVVNTNWDPTNRVEAGPAVTGAAGTGV